MGKQRAKIHTPGNSSMEQESSVMREVDAAEPASPRTRRNPRVNYSEKKISKVSRSSGFTNRGPGVSKKRPIKTTDEQNFVKFTAKRMKNFLNQKP